MLKRVAPSLSKPQKIWWYNKGPADLPHLTFCPTFCAFLSFPLLKKSLALFSTLLNTISLLLISPKNFFTDFIQRLFQDSRRKIDDFFTKTYGIVYQQNAHVFDEYFSALREYFQYGRVDINEATNRFFATIYKKMFPVMNRQYIFNQEYLRCVYATMDEIKPFGDRPAKLASSLKRSLIATRVLFKAIQSAYDIANEMVSVSRLF